MKRTLIIARPIPRQAKKVFQGKIFSVWQWKQKLYDGSTAVFERLKRADYAYAIGVLPNRNILLVEDEQPDRRAVLTPAGGGVNEGETPRQAIAREFEEETGYTIGRLTAWHSYQPNSKTDMLVHAFIGRDLHRTAEQKLEPGEKIRLVEFSFDEFLALGKNPRLRDWLLRITLLEALLEPQKKEDLRMLLYG